MRTEALAQGLTHTAIARRAKLTQQTVSMFFSGRNQSPKTAKKIADVLKRDLREFVVTTDEAVSA